MNYPEHEKLKKVQEKSQAIHEFIKEFLSKKGIMLGKYCTYEYETPSGRIKEKEDFLPWPEDLTKLVAEFFNIDLNKIETEKRQMLEECRQITRRL